MKFILVINIQLIVDSLSARLFPQKEESVTNERILVNCELQP